MYIITGEVCWLLALIQPCVWIITSSCYKNKNLVTPTGFVQSLEFLKNYGNLQTSFPDLEKVWKVEIQSGKVERTLELFQLFPFYNKHLIFELNVCQLHCS